eukprot:14919112-Ditylum_brightwellii.AAC.1
MEKGGLYLLSSDDASITNIETANAIDYAISMISEYDDEYDDDQNGEMEEKDEKKNYGDDDNSNGYCNE